MPQLPAKLKDMATGLARVKKTAAAAVTDAQFLKFAKGEWTYGAEEIEVQEGSKDETQVFAMRTEHILLVEDDELVREVSVSILRDQGYDIVEAKDGAEAIDHLEEGRAFDLLFTDIVLPGGMNGVEIAEKAKRLHPNIKVLFTTGYAENAAVQNGILDPGVIMINKPYRRAELLEKVNLVLAGDDS